MLLSSIRYTEFEGRDQEWVIEDLTLGRINLLVGKNATGKSRTLNVIGNLARLLRAEMPPTLSSADYTVRFANGRGQEYAFKVEDRQVVEESLTIGGDVLLARGGGGVGKLRADRIGGGTMIDFQAPQTDLAAVVRQDAIQHDYLRSLHEWAAAVRHYHFGTTLGKDNFAMIVPAGGAVADDRDAGQVVGLFRRAEKELGEAFKAAVLKDMRQIDYPIDDISVGPPISFRPTAPLPGEFVCLKVKEVGLRGETDQLTMSQGMFRVLSLLILINYSVLAKRAGCVLVDDIGEGLDFERSCLLINLLRQRAAESQVQLVISTNDKFVMNEVPLEEWSVLQRRGSRVKVLNYTNSRELFEEFKFTGLSNFSFLEMDFANGPPAEELAVHE